MTSLILLLACSLTPEATTQLDRITFTPRGRAPASVIDAEGAHVAGFVLAGPSATRGPRSAPEPVACPDDAALTCQRLSHGAVEELWRNTDDGLQQLFVVQATDGDGAVTVPLHLTHARWANVSDDRAWILGEGTAHLYGGLQSWDAHGRPLPSRFVATRTAPHDAGDLRIEVDTRGATFPIVVDPWVIEADGWANDASAAHVDRAVSSGDVDGDGLPDVALVTTTRAFETEVRWMAGNADAFDATPVAVTPSNVLSDANTLVSAGDLDGDGRGDFAGADRSQPANADRIRVWLGQAGLGGGPVTVDLPDPVPSVVWSPGQAGDIDGDGFDDLPATHTWIDGAGTHHGQLSVWRGQVGGPAQAASWTLPGPLEASADAVGDLDGDGFDDLAISEPGATVLVDNEGRVTVWFGSATGPDPARTWTVTGTHPHDTYGFASGLGDLNGDGYDDLAVLGEAGATLIGPGWQEWFSARLDVYLGGPASPSTTPAVSWWDPWGATHFGTPVAAGDVNGDGLDDLAVPVGTDAFSNVYIHLGTSTGVESAPWMTVHNAWLAAPTGDADGDGYADVAVVLRGPHTDNGGTLSLLHGMADPMADDDGDGVRAALDCADHDPSRPSARELWGDGIDQDCDGYDSFFELDPDHVDLSSGDTYGFRMAPARQGDRFILFVSTEGPGAGPCSPNQPALCLGLLHPRVAADQTVTRRVPWGDTTLQVTVPQVPSERTAWFQAVLIADNGTAARSQVVQTVIRP